MAIASYIVPEFSVPGWWRVQVDAFGQIEEKEFLVEKVFIPKFEVYVWNPEYMLSHQGRISGKIMAMYDTYSPVRGNATIKLYADSLGKPNGPEKSVFLYEEILDPVSTCTISHYKFYVPHSLLYFSHKVSKVWALCEMSTPLNV